MLAHVRARVCMHVIKSVEHMAPCFFFIVPLIRSEFVSQFSPMKSTILLPMLMRSAIINTE